MNSKSKNKFIAFLFIGIVVLGFIFVLLPPTAHAQSAPQNTDSVRTLVDRSSLSMSLRQGGGGPYEGPALRVWRIMLGLANVFVVVILMFLAVINILHIQYDTYQIKKSLPNLIIGIVLANFSLVICRMFIDAANVLTATVVGNNVVFNVLMPVTKNLGIFPVTVGTGAVAILSVIFSGGMSLGLILFAIVLISLPVIGLVIILFLLYIRIVVVLALACVSPLAFVAMGFSPTAGLFKQWWTQFLRWVFMKPIMLTVLWLAALLGSPSTTATAPTSLIMPGLTELVGLAKAQADNVPRGEGLSLVTWLITVGLVYLSFIVPFKLGGVIMGTWIKLGKKLGGLAYKGATQNPWVKADNAKNMMKLKERLSKFRPVQSFLNAQANEAKFKAIAEEQKAIAQGDARDRYNLRQGKETHYGDMARDAISNKRVREDYASFDLENNEELAKAVQQAETNGDHEGVKGLLKIGASNGMISDAMRSATDEMKKKYGTDLLDKKGNFKMDLASQKEFARRLMMGTSEKGVKEGKWKEGTDDIRVRQQVNNAMVKAGHYGAQTIVADETQTEGYRDLDLTNQEDKEIYKNMTQGRLKSAHAQKFWQTVRKESLFDDDGHITDTGVMILAALPPETVRMVSRARSNVLQQFNTPGNVERLNAAGLDILSAELSKIGAGAPAVQGQVIIRVDKSIQARDISSLKDTEIDDALKRQIIEKITNGYTPGQTITLKAADDTSTDVDAIQYIADEVNKNINFPENFRKHVKGLVALKQQQIEVKKLAADNLSAAETDQIVASISQVIGDKIGDALKNGVEISPIIQQIVSEARGPIKAILMKKIRDSIANSQANIIEPVGGISLDAVSIVEAYKKTKAPGKKLTELQIQQKFISELQKKAKVDLSASEMDRAWRLVEAYLGKASSRQKTGQQSNNASASRRSQAAIEDDDENN